MSLIPSLLRAIVLVNGDALILHTGEKPYVSTAGGRIELPGDDISIDAVSDVIMQLLPSDVQQTLTKYGAAQCELGELPEFPGERFQVAVTVTDSAQAVEIRRRLADAPPPSVAERAADTAPVTPRRRQADRLDPSAGMPADTTAPAPVGVAGRAAAAVAAAPVPDVREPDLLDRLLHAAFADGASALYLAAGVPPWLRMDDDLRVMQGAAPLTAAQIDAMLARAPETGVAAEGQTREWLWEFSDLGRVRCTSFHDHRGRGLVLRSVPSRPLTTRQLGLSREVEAFVAQGAGLVVVAAARATTSRTVIAALVDLINRTRRVHVVTIERELAVVHDCEGSLISQREAGRSLDRMLELSRAALREEPDVLVIETAQTAELMTLAFDAVHGGRLVICGFRGDSAAGVVADIVGLYSAGDRQGAQLSLARSLVGVVAESADGRARQSLTNRPDVACLIAEGKFADLHAG